jgi:hypothetical protein
LAAIVLFHLAQDNKSERENQHAAASCDLKQKIKTDCGLSGSGALADQHSSGGNSADRHTEARAGAVGKNIRQHYAISSQQSSIGAQPDFKLSVRREKRAEHSVGS